MTIQSLPSRTIFHQEQEYLFFSGVSYLGMGHQPDFKRALMQGFEKYGTIFSASRHNALKLKVYEQTEQFIAQATGAEAALTVSSGMLAGQVATKIFKNEPYIMAPNAHPAIWMEALPYPHLFKNRLDFETNIVEIIQKSGATLIVSDALDPLRCQPYHWDWIQNLPKDRPITLLVDDSHGIGITGEDGWGIFTILNQIIKNYNLQNIDLIVIASMAKALGIPGGVILGNQKHLSTIWNSPHFAGASPIMPAYLEAFLHFQPNYAALRQQLSANIDFLNENLTQMGLNKAFKTLDNYPIFYTERDAYYDELLKQKVWISSFPYPNPKSKPITRLVLSALHTKSDIKQLVNALRLG
jgi:7-keto-8-aminopelargonate synthetase-like enzyme